MVTDDPGLFSRPAPGSCVDADDGDDDGDANDHPGSGSSNVAPGWSCRNDRRARSGEPGSAILPDSSRHSTDLMNTSVKDFRSAFHAYRGHDYCGGIFSVIVARQENQKRVTRPDRAVGICEQLSVLLIVY